MNKYFLFLLFCLYGCSTPYRDIESPDVLQPLQDYRVPNLDGTKRIL